MDFKLKNSELQKIVNKFNDRIGDLNLSIEGHDPRLGDKNTTFYVFDHPKLKMHANAGNPFIKRLADTFKIAYLEVNVEVPTSGFANYETTMRIPSGGMMQRERCIIMILSSVSLLLMGVAGENHIEDMYPEENLLKEGAEGDNDISEAWEEALS